MWQVSSRKPVRWIRPMDAVTSVHGRGARRNTVWHGQHTWQRRCWPVCYGARYGVRVRAPARQRLRSTGQALGGWADGGPHCDLPGWLGKQGKRMGLYGAMEPRQEWQRTGVHGKFQQRNWPPWLSLGNGTRVSTMRMIFSFVFLRMSFSKSTYYSYNKSRYRNTCKYIESPSQSLKRPLYLPITLRFLKKIKFNSYST